MELLVARQPILDRNRDIYGYELLFRQSKDQYFGFDDGNEATLTVIGAALVHFGLPDLVGSRYAFFNFTADLLRDDFCLMLPPRQTVIEILEDIELDPEIVQRCRTLRQMGFRIALDDVVHTDRCIPLRQAVDYIKVDFMAAAPAEIEAIAREYGRGEIRLLAEKVETLEVFCWAESLGYDYFQGYFFEKPQTLSKQLLEANPVLGLELLQQTQKRDFDQAKASDLLKREPALTIQLLRMVNSASFGFRYKIASIEQAILMLGQETFRRWVAVAVITHMCRENIALVHQAVQRARLAEQLAPHFALPHRAEMLFLTGLFSLGEAIVGRPLAEVLLEFSFDNLIAQTLLGEATELSPVLELVVALERNDRTRIEAIAASAKLPQEVLFRTIAEAYSWLLKLEI